MITLNINLKYNRSSKEMEKDSALTDSQLTQDYINFAANAKYKNGLDDATKRRIYARIQRKLDDAIEAGEGTITLEKAESDFLKDCMKEPPFPAALSKYVVVLEDEFERMISESKDKKGDAEEVEKSEEKK